jgi:hypothetical protein
MKATRFRSWTTRLRHGFDMNLDITTPLSEFLAFIEVYDVDAGGTLIPRAESSELQAIACPTAASGLPQIVTDSSMLPPDIAAVLIFPIYRDGEIVSVVALAAAEDEAALGVFEIWEPEGPFLRAAGASAEELTTAVGIPIFDDDFVASVVLISSAKSPLARGIEIWVPQGDAFSLLEGSYPGLGLDFQLAAGTALAAGTGLPGMAAAHGGACISSEAAVYAAGRKLLAEQVAAHRGLALPYYDQDVLTSVVVLLF